MKQEMKNMLVLIGLIIGVYCIITMTNAKELEKNIKHIWEMPIHQTYWKLKEKQIK